MTNKSLTQGQGVSTEFKERGLQAAFTINLRIFQAKFGSSPFNYFHFDLNSGNGMNEEVGCIGSPLAFLKAVEETGVQRFFAGFCDMDAGKLALLFSRPELQRNDCWAFNGDNSEFPYSIPDIIRNYGENPSKAIGMVLSDPNGPNVPLEALEFLAKESPRLDIVINWNSARAKGHRLNPVYGGDHYPTLGQVINRIKKNHWLIRQPLSSHQFTLLIGRQDLRTGNHRTLGFYHLDSPQGQAIFAQCNFTREQLKEQRMATQGGLWL